MYIGPGCDSHVVLEQLKGPVLVTNVQNFPLISFRQLSAQSLLVYKVGCTKVSCKYNSDEV